jgi:hypothetical protein
MVETTFTIPAADFNDEIVEKIKAYLQRQQGEVTISFKSKPSVSMKNETREEYFERLARAKENVESKRNLVSFTQEEFEALVQKLDSPHAQNPV